MSEGETDPEVQRALARLLRASIDFTRAYQAWSVDPAHHQRDLVEAEHRLDEAQQEAARREARARHQV